MRIEEANAIHKRLLEHRRAHRQAEHQVAVLLADLADRRLYAELGYASVFDYADRVLDLPARQARDRIRIGRHLPELPALAAALARQFLHHQSDPTDPATGERYRFVILDSAQGGDPRGRSTTFRTPWWPRRPATQR